MSIQRSAMGASVRTQIVLGPKRQPKKIVSEISIFPVGIEEGARIARNLPLGC
jgi:hypothetical protein